MCDMTTVEKIKVDIAALPRVEIELLREWLNALAEHRFDESIERDAKAGKLDGLMAEAEANYRAGRRKSI